ncbi:neural proliferation differentiation and control protein 1a isoform X2 [Cynoglossus semilaevis]|uniref:neural proliferation differentiation and control protein 1a isoform X2 n=1 Tax=Cynoglossus semilaevis TaxID=244447 RepID=UPI00049839C4|nr:neural proliferation differentiation and control protein 1-like isoform X2 [Cynoglossus semilaevis]
MMKKRPKMLLLCGRRRSFQSGASVPLLPLLLILLCVPVTAAFPGSSYPDLDEEIDFLQAILQKIEISESKAKEHKHQHLVSLQPTDEKTRTKQKSRLYLSSDKIVTPAPKHKEYAIPNTTTVHPRATGKEGRVGPLKVSPPKKDVMMIIMISLCVTVGTVAVLLATICYVKLQKDSRLAQKVDYPAFSGTGAPPATTNGASMGDKTLAHNAQMYHYQHQKQQMLSMGNHKQEQKVLDSEATSDEEEVGGDFTVYECPGLAPTGEMEVKNPLFDDSTLQYQENHK